MTANTPDSGNIKHKSQFTAIAGLLLAMIFWSSSFMAMKTAFRYYDPFVIFGRMAVASAGLFFYPPYSETEIRKGSEISPAHGIL